MKMNNEINEKIDRVIASLLAEESEKVRDVNLDNFFQVKYYAQKKLNIDLTFDEAEETQLRCLEILEDTEEEERHQSYGVYR